MYKPVYKSRYDRLNYEINKDAIDFTLKQTKSLYVVLLVKQCITNQSQLLSICQHTRLNHKKIKTSDKFRHDRFNQEKTADQIYLAMKNDCLQL